MTKPRVLVVLGAGSTLHAGAPSTQAIDEMISGIDDKAVHKVVSRLETQRGSGNYNFETVLAALEDLDEFSVRKRVPSEMSRPGGDLAAFTDWLPDFTPMASSSFVTARARLIGDIKDFVIARTARSSPSKLQSFFDQLAAVFDLTVVTLNYDDLIDRANNWYDGFHEVENPGGAGSFDFCGFSKRVAQHPAVLLHLHGSVRFDFPRVCSAIPSCAGEIVRYGRPRCGLGFTLHPPKGIAQPTPIIAGNGKDRWMTRACVPFGYYYGALVNTIQACPRVLVAGYGGGDQHVNSWLEEEHPRLHGARRRIVRLNPQLKKTSATAECLSLGCDKGYFPPADLNQVNEISSFLNQH